MWRPLLTVDSALLSGARPRVEVTATPLHLSITKGAGIIRRGIRHEINGPAFRHCQLVVNFLGY